MAREYPDELTPALKEMLEFMLWDTAGIAAVLRITGQDIPRKAEAEQSAALHWLIKIALDHGDRWRKVASSEVQRIRAEHPAAVKAAG